MDDSRTDSAEYVARILDKRWDDIENTLTGTRHTASQSPLQTFRRYLRRLRNLRWLSVIFASLAALCLILAVGLGCYVYWNATRPKPDETGGKPSLPATTEPQVSAQGAAEKNASAAESPCEDAKVFKYELQQLNSQERLQKFVAPTPSSDGVEAFANKHKELFNKDADLFAAEQKRLEACNKLTAALNELTIRKGEQALLSDWALIRLLLCSLLFLVIGAVAFLLPVEPHLMFAAEVAQAERKRSGGGDQIQAVIAPRLVNAVAGSGRFRLLSREIVERCLRTESSSFVQSLAEELVNKEPTAVRELISKGLEPGGRSLDRVSYVASRLLLRQVAEDPAFAYLVAEAAQKKEPLATGLSPFLSKLGNHGTSGSPKAGGNDIGAAALLLLGFGVVPMAVTGYAVTRSVESSLKERSATIESSINELRTELRHEIEIRTLTETRSAEQLVDKTVERTFYYPSYPPAEAKPGGNNESSAAKPPMIIPVCCTAQSNQSNSSTKGAGDTSPSTTNSAPATGTNTAAPAEDRLVDFSPEDLNEGTSETIDGRDVLVSKPRNLSLRFPTGEMKHFVIQLVVSPSVKWPPNPVHLRIQEGEKLEKGKERWDAFAEKSPIFNKDLNADIVIVESRKRSFLRGDNLLVLRVSPKPLPPSKPDTKDSSPKAATGARTQPYWTSGCVGVFVACGTGPYEAPTSFRSGTTASSLRLSPPARSFGARLTLIASG